MRVFELARELKLDSSDVLAHAKKLKFDAKAASSGLDAGQADKIRAAAKTRTPAKKAPAKTTAKKAPAETTAAKK